MSMIKNIIVVSQCPKNTLVGTMVGNLCQLRIYFQIIGVTMLWKRGTQLNHTNFPTNSGKFTTALKVSNTILALFYDRITCQRTQQMSIISITVSSQNFSAQRSLRNCSRIVSRTWINIYGWHTPYFVSHIIYLIIKIKGHHMTELICNQNDDGDTNSVGRKTKSVWDTGRYIKFGFAI